MISPGMVGMRARRYRRCREEVSCLYSRGHPNNLFYFHCGEDSSGARSESLNPLALSTLTPQ